MLRSTLESPTFMGVEGEAVSEAVGKSAILEMVQLL